MNIYCRAMGTLLNTALVEIISRVIALEVRTEHDTGCVGEGVSMQTHCWRSSSAS